MTADMKLSNSKGCNEDKKWKKHRDMRGDFVAQFITHRTQLQIRVRLKELPLKFWPYVIRNIEARAGGTLLPAVFKRRPDRVVNSVLNVGRTVHKVVIFPTNFT